MTNQAKIYPDQGDNPTINYSDQSRAQLGFCFSGGGSRALTCAWGQLLGLNTLGLINSARYISSVSGGTWASSIFHFLPSSVSDSELLGSFYPPEKLSLSDGDGKLNVNSMGENCLGKVPEGMGLSELAEKAATFLILHHESDYKWLWAYLVGKFVLKPFGLASSDSWFSPWESSKYFTLSREYAEKNFPSDAPSLEDFYFVREGRPFPIMNNNIMESRAAEGKLRANIVQLPNQVTPVSGGAPGETPGGVLKGGGTAESYANASFLDQSSAVTSPVKISVSQPYSLIDIVSTSSAFFAETVASLMVEHVKDPEKKKSLISRIESHLKPDQKETLISKILSDFKGFLDSKANASEAIGQYLEKIVLEDLSFFSKIIPQYNFWPLGDHSENRLMEFTDGGTLENTGILGLLAQTDTGKSDNPLSLVAFDNTSTPLVKKDGKIIAGGQAAPLFGIHFDDETGAYRTFSEDEKDPSHKNFLSESLLQVFDNSPDTQGSTPFDRLVQGLYNSSLGKSGDKEEVNFEAPWCNLTLKTVDNSLAAVTAGREIAFFYVQNAAVNKWQNSIGDVQLKNEIEKGQSGGKDPFTPFKNFPYYSTGFKIGLEAKESHTLSQMWAWAVASEESSLKAEIEGFIQKNSSSASPVEKRAAEKE